MNVLLNRVTAVNELHTYLNQVAPKIYNYVEKHGVRINKDYSIFKKDKEYLNKLLANPPKNVRVYISNCEYSGLIIKADTNYKDSEWSCSYYRNDIYIKRPWEPLELWDYEAINTDKAKLEGLREQVSALNSEIWAIERLIGSR